jgi:two-component system phosphate regulon sensor histidine kinase PhoR
MSISSGVLLRQVLAPIGGLIAISALTVWDYSTLEPGPERLLRVALHAVVIVTLLAVIVRTVRRFSFSSELVTMLREVQAGVRSRRFYFQHAYGPEDRSVALALSESLKTLDRRLRYVMEQRESEGVVISSMAEGVLVIDQEEKIVRINPAAANFLGTTPEDALGRAIQEVARNSELQRFVGNVIAKQRPEEGEIVLQGSQNRSLRMSGRELLSSEGEPVGCIVVLSDITRLRRLERTRSDFIANVSHELKTPVTSIQGFAETLLDGALDSPVDARKFLGIIARQAERLGKIFDEMLVLSKLEQEEQVVLKSQPIRPILELSAQASELRAESKKITIEISCPNDLQAACNEALLEQAISNLIDNAVKYSPAGSNVAVCADQTEGQVFISVKDNGPGIESQHLPRIFERFYRVDKGRSRAEGGTGLGLAIVKHIAQVHGGQAVVESTPSKGSTFTIFLKSNATTELTYA